jgi:SMODS and SLOG-associating 2TM effector domain 2
VAAQNGSSGTSENLNPGSISWGGDNTAESTRQLTSYVESEADKAMAWYWRSKRWKARLSRLIQLSVIVLTALAGLFPIVVYLTKDMKWPYLSESGLWPSLFVGIAAALIGIDRAFGLSSGWSRYVLTATSIRKMLEEFRFDCALMMAKPGQNVSDRSLAIVQRAKEFRLAVEEAVFQETKDWASEFQNNISQMEKDVKAQLEALKGELAKAKVVQVQKEPGALEVSIPNAATAQNSKVQINLDGASGPLAEDVLQGSNKWVRLGVAPGPYKIAVRATINGAPAASTTAILVKSGEIVKVEIPLPA